MENHKMRWKASTETAVTWSNFERNSRPDFGERHQERCRDPSIALEEFLGPSGPKLERELKMSPRGLPAPGGPKKLKKKSRKRVKWKFQLFFNFFDSFSTLFLTFGALGPEGPRNSLSTPFPTLGPKGPRAPLGGWKGRKSRALSRLSRVVIVGTCYRPLNRRKFKSSSKVTERRLLEGRAKAQCLQEKCRHPQLMTPKKRHHSLQGKRLPPPRENITKIIRPEYFCVIFVGGYGKIA